MKLIKLYSIRDRSRFLHMPVVRLMQYCYKIHLIEKHVRGLREFSVANGGKRAERKGVDQGLNEDLRSWKALHGCWTRRRHSRLFNIQSHSGPPSGGSGMRRSRWATLGPGESSG